MNVPHRLVQGGRRHQVPGHTGRSSTRRARLLKAKGPSLRLRARVTASATTTAGCIPCCGRTARRERSTRTARPCSSTLTRRRGPSISPPLLQARPMIEDVPGLDRRRTTTRRSSASRSPAPTTPPSILVVGQARLPEIAKVTDHALNPAGPQGPLPHAEPQIATPSSIHAPDQAAAKAFLRWLIRRQAARAWLTVRPTPTTRRILHGYDNHPMWNAEPRYLPYKESLKTSRLPRLAWAAEPRHVRRAWLSTSLVDMFAKARRRATSTKDVIATAASPARSRSTKRSSPRWRSRPAIARADRRRSRAGRFTLPRPRSSARGSSAGSCWRPASSSCSPFVAYPFFYGIFLSLQDRPVASAGTFVGLRELR